MIGDTFEYVDRYFGIQILPELDLSKRKKMGENRQKGEKKERNASQHSESRGDERPRC
jgi:hypothetical protein